MWIVDAVKAIPEVIWAAAIGSILTWVGVLLTNKDNRLQLVERLRHDSEQRDREREMALRRDIYVPAAEGVNRLLRLTYSLSNLSLTDQQIDSEMKESSAAISKLQIVGSNALLSATNRFMYEFNLAYMNLILKRAPLIDRKSRADSLNALLSKVGQDQERLLEYMRQLNMAGNPNPSAWDTVQKSFQYGQEQQKKLSEQLQALSNEQYEQSLQFSDASMSEGSKLGDLVPPMVFAARRDLELELDESDYLNQHNAYMEKSREAFRKFLSEAKKLMSR